MDDSRIVLVREPYRIAAVTEEHNDSNILGYAILTKTGARLHYGLMLEGVMVRLEELLREEGRKSTEAERRNRVRR